MHHMALKQIARYGMGLSVAIRTMYDQRPRHCLRRLISGPCPHNGLHRLRTHGIVGIKKHDLIRSRMLETCLARVGGSPPGFAQKLQGKAAVHMVAGPILHRQSSGIRRGIVDDYHAQRTVGLGINAVQTPSDEMGAVVDGHHHSHAVSVVFGFVHHYFNDPYKTKIE